MHYLLLMDATNTSTEHTTDCEHGCDFGRITCEDDSVIACECPEGQDVAAEWDACDGAW